MMASPRWRLAALIFAMLFVESSAAQDDHQFLARDEVVEVTGAAIPYVNRKYYVQKTGAAVLICNRCCEMYDDRSLKCCPHCKYEGFRTVLFEGKKWATTDVSLVCEVCESIVKNKETPCYNCHDDEKSFRADRCIIQLNRQRKTMFKCPEPKCHSGGDKGGYLEKGCLKGLNMNCPNPWHYCPREKCRIGNRCKKPGQVLAAGLPAYTLTGRRIKASGQGGRGDETSYICHRCKNDWQFPQSEEYTDVWHITNASGNSLYWNETNNGQLPMNRSGWKYLPMTMGGRKIRDPNMTYEWWEGGLLMRDSGVRCPKLCTVVSPFGPWVKKGDVGQCLSFQTKGLHKCVGANKCQCGGVWIVWCGTCKGTGLYNKSKDIVLKKSGRRRLQELTGYRTINRLLREEKRSRRTSNLPDRV